MNLQKQVLEVEKVEPVFNVPTAPKIPEVAIPKTKINIAEDLEKQESLRKKAHKPLL